MMDKNAITPRQDIITVSCPKCSTTHSVAVESWEIGHWRIEGCDSCGEEFAVFVGLSGKAIELDERANDTTHGSVAVSERSGD